MEPATPIILFIRGGWHTLEPYQKFIDILESRGLIVVAPDLPSAAAETPEDPPGDDVRHFAEVARALADAGKEIVVVAHSYGGTIATDAMVGLGVAARQAAGQRGGVKRMLYVAGFMLQKGASLEEAAPAELVGWCVYEGDLKVFKAGTDVGPIFYPDIPPEEQQKVLRGVVKHPKACSFYKPTAAAYAEIPTTFVFCEKDLAFPYPAQRATIEAHKSNGIEIDEVTLPSGHFPSLSMPEKLAEVVGRYLD
ncbi:alpha/beta-hydrolase [Thozetella sp. PMI_491]|nr:alpha/beta-hydrolase [Thozetella sp. PMI_491]